jgi:hypothetical protein
VNHPFQQPLNPSIVIDTETNSVDECVNQVISKLEELGVLDESLADDYEFLISRQEEREGHRTARRQGSVVAEHVPYARVQDVRDRELPAVGEVENPVVGRWCSASLVAAPPSTSLSEAIPVQKRNAG